MTQGLFIFKVVICMIQWYISFSKFHNDSLSMNILHALQFFTFFFITSSSHHRKIINDTKNIIESIFYDGRISKIENRSHDLIYVAFINEMSEQDPAKNHF